jgi:hypothetical protein
MILIGVIITAFVFMYFWYKKAVIKYIENEQREYKETYLNNEKLEYDKENGEGD